MTDTDPTTPSPTPDDRPTEALGSAAPPPQPAAAGSPDPTQPGAGWYQGAPSPGAGYPPPTSAYPPPGASYPPPGPAYPPPGAPYPPPWPSRRLTRSRDDRMLAGVCGGLARYWNTDPVLLRILAVVLTLFTGGALAIGYLIALIAIPEEPMSTGGPAPFAPTPEPGQVGYASGGNPAYAGQASYAAPAPPRERSHLGWLIVSVALLVAGILGLVGFLVPASVQMWGIIGGVSLAILGVGMLVGTRYGRARWLVFLAVPLAFITFATVTAGNWVQQNPNWDRWTTATADGTWGGLTIGDRTWTVTPADRADSPLQYRLTAGEATLDLTALTDAARPEQVGQRIEIDAGVGLGQLRVLVPDDVVVDLTATVDAGQIDLPGQAPLKGENLSVDTTVPQATPAEDAPAYIVTLDAAIGAGNLEVLREAA